MFITMNSPLPTTITMEFGEINWDDLIRKRLFGQKRGQKRKRRNSHTQYANGRRGVLFSSTYLSWIYDVGGRYIVLKPLTSISNVKVHRKKNYPISSSHNLMECLEILPIDLVSRRPFQIQILLTFPAIYPSQTSFLSIHIPFVFSIRLSFVFYM